MDLLEEVDVKGISHITGGGFYENIPRSLKKGCCALLLKLSAPVALRNSFSECERVSMIFYRRIGCVPDKIVIGYPLAPRLSSCRNSAVFAVLFFNLYRSCCSVFSPGACVGLVCSESMNKVFVKRKLSGRFSYL